MTTSNPVPLSKAKKETLQSTLNHQVERFTLEGKVFTTKVTNVYDADTCQAVFYLNDQLVRYTLRLKGIDTSEMRPSMKKPNRELEKKAAKRSRNRLIQLVTNSEIKLDDLCGKKKCQKILDQNTLLVTLQCHEFDKYGRLLGSLYPPGSNKSETGSKSQSSQKGGNSISANQLLIDEGFAYEYHGGTKKNWNF